MTLKDLLQGVQILSVQAEPTMEVGGVSCDSRAVTPGEVFVAVSGTSRDGEQFITEALENGAVCVVCERPPLPAVPWITVPCARRALALMAANQYGHPAEETLSRLNEYDVTIYRTDLSGTLVFHTKGG